METTVHNRHAASQRTDPCPLQVLTQVSVGPMSPSATSSLGTLMVQGAPSEQPEPEVCISNRTPRKRATYYQVISRLSLMVPRSLMSTAST